MYQQMKSVPRATVSDLRPFVRINMVGGSRVRATPIVSCRTRTPGRFVRARKIASATALRLRMSPLITELVRSTIPPMIADGLTMKTGKSFTSIATIATEKK